MKTILLSALAFSITFGSCFYLGYALASPRPDPRFGAGVVEIGEISTSELAPVLKKADQLVKKGAKTITFRINSFGGGVYAGMDFIQHIEDYNKRGIKTICAVDSRAMSMGFGILQACQERLMTRRSVLLAHNASTNAGGTAKDLESSLQLLRAIDNAFAELCGRKLKMSLDEYKKKIDGRDWSFNYDEALKVGAVDALVEPEALPPAYELEAPDKGLFFFLTK